MVNRIPPVSRYMTKSPHTIGADQPMSTAHSEMREHGIRHLPVLEGGKLVGVLSDGDLHLVETLSDVDPSVVRVEEAMSTSVYVVSPKTPIDGVVTEMAKRKLGSAIVVDRGKVVGIFTTVDVCTAFAATLRPKPAARAAAKKRARPAARRARKA